MRKINIANAKVKNMEQEIGTNSQEDKVWIFQIEFFMEIHDADDGWVIYCEYNYLALS